MGIGIGVGIDGDRDRGDVVTWSLKEGKGILILVIFLQMRRKLLNHKDGKRTPTQPIPPIT